MIDWLIKLLDEPETKPKPPPLVLPPTPVLRPTSEAIAIGEFASKNFKWEELACKGNCRSCPYGEDGPISNVSMRAIRKLQIVRDIVEQPLTINSAARCPRHNALIGGVPLSQHRSTDERPSTAFDIALTLPKEQLIRACEQAGFTGIGANYRTFVHADDRSRPARW